MQDLFKKEFKNELVKYQIPQTYKDEYAIIDAAVKALSGNGPWENVAAAQKMWQDKRRESRSKDTVKGDIKILTQNMFMLLPAVPEHIKLYKDERMIEFARSIMPQYDIICLQEVFSGFNHRRDFLENMA